MSEPTPNKKTPAPPYRGILITLLILIVLSAVIISGVFWYARSYDDRLYPKTFIGPYDVSGMTYAEAEEYVTEQANRYLDRGIEIQYQDKTFGVPSVLGDPANPELTLPVYSYDIERTFALLKRENRSHNELGRLWYSLAGSDVSLLATVNTPPLMEIIREQVGSSESPAVNARLMISDEGVAVEPESSGMRFNPDTISKDVLTQLQQFREEPVGIELERDTPAITEANSQEAVSLVDQVLRSAPFILIYDTFAWKLDQQQVRDWLEFQVEEGAVTVGLQYESLEPYLEQMAADINVEVREAKFAMEGSRVIEFQPSQTGRELKMEESWQEINRKIRQIGIQDIDLVVEEIEPEMTTESVNSLGIQELIGEGHSNFYGSPANRRHNINVGADTLNGILIEPGEEFSLVGALGAIEASTGYLPELVIKGNKTIPEYGGGLCQIGTTTFRAAVNAGFPITERKNHSYRVSYYEPAGTDATIYDPKPDFRFVNDTEHHVLFTTEVDGNDLYFRFYGTHDGRKVTVTEPKIYNYVAPGPTKLIETTDLAPGEKKCTERAHTGADAEFTRTITDADGTETSETFTSHYKPWQEVCLIGVSEAPAE